LKIFGSKKFFKVLLVQQKLKFDSAYKLPHFMLKTHFGSKTRLSDKTQLCSNFSY